MPGRPEVKISKELLATIEKEEGTAGDLGGPAVDSIASKLVGWLFQLQCWPDLLVTKRFLC